MNDAVRNKLQGSSQRLYTDSLRKKMINGGVAGMNGVNGTITNGHIPRNFHKMNINVNPLSEMETMSQTTDSSNHYSVSSSSSSFHVFSFSHSDEKQNKRCSFKKRLTK